MSPPRSDEEFVRLADDAVRHLARNAALDADEFLDPAHWRETCDDTADYYNTYDWELDGALRVLLANGGRESRSFEFLATAELETDFPPFDIGTASYGFATAAVRYVLARVLVRLLTGTSHEDLGPRAEAALGALWAQPTLKAQEARQRWMPIHVLLTLAIGGHAKVIDEFERDHRYTLTRDEGAARSIVKACYLLARIAAGTADAEVTIGARAHLTLLKWGYHLWRIDGDRSAEIDLIPLVCLCLLHERIVNGASPSRLELFESLRPARVLQEMQAGASKQ